MPILNDNLTQTALPTGHYGYSGTRLDDLGATEYTLVTIVCDVSPSVRDFVKEMEEALRQIVQACRLSPRADNLMLRLVTFHGRVDEAHGFKLLERCNLNDYRRCLRIGAATALYDGSENGVAALADYGSKLRNADFAANGILFIITDGEDNASTLGVRQVREALEAVVREESLESLVSILVGVNVKDRRIGAFLQDFRTEAGITQYLELDQANAKDLAKLANFVSRSISAQSQALGGGAAAKPLGF